MKKRILIICSAILIAVLILFCPFSVLSYDDGGTKAYAALTYKIVKWKRHVSVYNADGDIDHIDTYNATSVFFFPDNFKTVSELWRIESGDKPKTSSGPVSYSCDLSRFPSEYDLSGYGKILSVEEERLLISPGSDKDKGEFGEVVWLICDEAYAYSEGQVVTYTFRNVTAGKKGEPLNIIALLVYME